MDRLIEFFDFPIFLGLGSLWLSGLGAVGFGFLSVFFLLIDCLSGCVEKEVPFTSNMGLFGTMVTGLLSCGILALFGLILLGVGQVWKKKIMNSHPLGVEIELDEVISRNAGAESFNEENHEVNGIISLGQEAQNLGSEVINQEQELGRENLNELVPRDQRIMGLESQQTQIEIPPKGSTLDM